MLPSAHPLETAPDPVRLVPLTSPAVAHLAHRHLAWAIRASGWVIDDDGELLVRPEPCSPACPCRHR